MPPTSTSATWSSRRSTQKKSTTRETIAVGSDTNRAETRPTTTSETKRNHPETPINNESGDGCMDLDSEQSRSRASTSEMSVGEFLDKLKLDENYLGLFEREKICMEVLAEMGHEQLKEIGIDAYGVRHRILKGVDKYYKSLRDPFFNAPTTGSLVVELEPGCNEYEMVGNEMLTSIRVHKDDFDSATKIRTYDIVKIEKIKNRKLWTRFEHRRKEIQEENGGHENERLLFHGSPYWTSIVERGFDERHACIQGKKWKIYEKIRRVPPFDIFESRNFFGVLYVK